MSRSKAQRVIHRIPPYQLGAQVLMVNDVTDRQPWSLVSHRIPDLFAQTKGKGITVAVLDTGLWRHRDLPDPVFAVNFSNSPSVYDAVGHGTHVAGTIGARLNGAGVVGWAPECTLGVCKVLGDDGSGDDEAIAKGIRYAADSGAHIINMSLGGGYSAKIEQACKDVIQRGVFLICVAGNEGVGNGNENTIGYPARLPETLAIASYRKDGSISEFSSRGPEVDVAFPGEAILSCWLNNTFREISGTSMATPAACGLTALMLAAHHDANIPVTINNNADLRALWKKHAQDMGQPGFDTAFGWGIPDAAGIIRDAVTASPIVTPPVTQTPPTKPDLSGAFSLLGLTFVPMTHQGKTGFFVSVQ